MADKALLPGESFSGALTRASGETVTGGPYGYKTGTLIAGGAGSNYTLVLDGTNTFAITPRPDTINVTTGQSKIFGSADPAFAYTYTPTRSSPATGLSGSDAFSGALTRVLGETVGNYNILQSGLTIKNGTADVSSNYNITYNGTTFAILANPCLLTHDPVTNFISTANPGTPTSLWFSIRTEVNGQLVNDGDYLSFTSGNITFNNITSSPAITNLSLPNGRIVADKMVTAPVTSYDAATNMWTTRIPLKYNCSSSDIFISGAIINSGTGFVKNTNANYVVKGIFTSNRDIYSEWEFGIAAYRLSSPTYYLNYSALASAGKVISIDGAYKAGTPTPFKANLISGAGGTGGSNYTGSICNDNFFTACKSATMPGARIITNSFGLSEDRPVIQEARISEARMEVYPNPASTNIKLSFVPGSNGASKITLLTIDEQKVMEINNGILEAGKKYVKSIDISKFVSGVYLIQLTEGGRTTIKKVIITR
jgi:hypothetical protein